jgi:ATP-binding cassette subfamily B protein/ATP-binding cassette subfamily C protein LapB
MNNTLVYSFKKILHFYYGEVDLQTIDKLSPNGLENFSIEDIKEVSKELKLDFSYKKVDISSIQNYMLPAIAIDKNKNAFVVEKIDRKNIHIYNPISQKRYKLSLKKLKDSPLDFIFISKKHKEINYIEDSDKNSKKWFFKPLLK